MHQFEIMLTLILNFEHDTLFSIHLLQQTLFSFSFPKLCLSSSFTFLPSDSILLASIFPCTRRNSCSPLPFWTLHPVFLATRFIFPLMRIWTLLSVLLIKTLSSDVNVLCLCCPTWQPGAPWDYSALDLC